MPLLVIVRHGQSQWNLENKFTGNVDVNLTELGKEEARIAGKKLAGIIFNAGFTSLLIRAQQTLQIILSEIDQQGLLIKKDKALNERYYGDLQGLDKTATEEKFGLAQVDIWRRSFSIKPPGGESLEETAMRVVPYYKKEIEPLLKLNENILVVAHGNSLRALMMHLENINEKDIADINIPTGVPRLYHFDNNLKMESATYL